MVQYQDGMKMHCWPQKQEEVGKQEAEQKQQLQEERQKQKQEEGNPGLPHLQVNPTATDSFNPAPYTTSRSTGGRDRATDGPSIDKAISHTSTTITQRSKTDSETMENNHSHLHHPSSRGSSKTGSKTLEGLQPPRGPPVCSGCGRHIVDRYMCHLRGELWHSSCLICTDCRMPLQKSCFQSDDKLYCGEHFFRRFGTRCSGCGEGIPPSDLVRRAHNNVYHIACFTCTVCSTLLDTGDQFYLKADNSLICKADYDKVRHSCSTTTDEEDEENSPNTKRPRTSINAEQLEGLKNAYNVTRKPSKSMREELGKKYGLDIKVIQVWFQNRRAKEKRLRKEAEGGPEQGGPGTAQEHLPIPGSDETGNTCFLATKYPQTQINGYAKFNELLGTEAPPGVSHEKRPADSSCVWQADATSNSSSNSPPKNNNSTKEQHTFTQIHGRPLSSAASEDQYQVQEPQFTIQGAVMCAPPSGQTGNYSLSSGQTGNYSSFPVSPQMDNGKPREWYM